MASIIVKGRKFVINDVVLTSSPEFTYTLQEEKTTSAGVYDSSGSLIRTLWNNVVKSGGTYVDSWDGSNDLGLLVEDGSYEIVVTTSKMNHKWLGVVGNTSDRDQEWKTRWKGLDAICGVAVGTNYIYTALHYNEGRPALNKFDRSNPKVRLQVYGNTEATSLRARVVCTDDRYVYWMGEDDFSKADNNIYTSMIFATTTTGDTAVIFANGRSYQFERGDNYPSVIGFKSGTTIHTDIWGGAVQKNGNLLFAARPSGGTVTVYNKTTGAQIAEHTYTAPKFLATDSVGDLWMVYDGIRIAKFSVNSSTGAFTPLNILISGVTQPCGISVSANDKVYITDGGDQQIIKVYNNPTTANTQTSPIQTFGLPGGYSSSPSVIARKFHFSDPANENILPISTVAHEADGSFWVVDQGVYRLQKFQSLSATTASTTVQYIPRLYSVSADGNDPSRIFAENLEFSVDYSKDLDDVGGWTLSRNWGYNILDNYGSLNFRLHNVNTVTRSSKTKTYCLIKKGSEWGVFLLDPVSGLTKKDDIVYEYNEFYPDGSIRAITRATNGQQTIFKKKELLSIDSNDVPIWEADYTEICRSPVNTSGDPRFSGNDQKLNVGEITSSGVAIVVDVASNTSSSYSQLYKLGGIDVATNTWKFRTSKKLDNYVGIYPPDGSFDVGNLGSFGGGAGMGVKAMGNTFVNGYHGEGWKAGQTNMWSHYHENGLMIGQFGNTSFDIQYDNNNNPVDPFGMAGNAFSFTSSSSGSTWYLIHGDENYYGGVHIWEITGFNTIENVKVNIVSSKPNGLKFHYYSGLTLNNANYHSSSDVSTVNTTTVPLTSFSGRYEGHIKALYSENYTFHVSCSKGVRVMVNNLVLIDQWNNNTLTEFSATTVLTANAKYAIEVQYQGETGGSTISLSWSSASQSKQIMPNSALFNTSTRKHSRTTIDLLEGLNLKRTLSPYPLLGWSRNPSGETLTSRSSDYWSILSGYQTYGNNMSNDLWVQYKKGVNNTPDHYVDRDLGTNNSLSMWAIKSRVSFNENYGNAWSPLPQTASSTLQAGVFFEVLDSTSKVIATTYYNQRFTTPNFFEGYGNRKALFTGVTMTDIELLLKKPLDLNIVATSATNIAFKFGDYTGTSTAVYETGATWNNPKTFRVKFVTIVGSSGRVREVDITDLKFERSL